MIEELQKELWSLIHKWRTTPNSSGELEAFVEMVYNAGYEQGADDYYEE